MTVTLSLGLIGNDDPLWVAWLQPDKVSFMKGQNCCETGHNTPEEAASHGGALAATWLSQYARALKPPAIGALALAGQSLS